MGVIKSFVVAHEVYSYIGFSLAFRWVQDGSNIIYLNVLYTVFHVETRH
jgi:hypothetical protein